MSCPHSLKDSPDRCSQCLGVPVRRVEQDGAVVRVGDETRPLDRERAQTYYQRRGGKR